MSSKRLRWLLAPGLLVLGWMMGYAKAETEAEMEVMAHDMSLCPVSLPPDASDDAKVLASSLSFDLLNPEHLDGPDILVEGDIVMSLQQWQDMHSSILRKGVDSQSKLWPIKKSTGYPTVFYKMDPTVKSPSKIVSAMSAWESQTCVRFHETSSNFKPYVQIFQGQGCYSYIGKTGALGQALSIGSSCYTGKIIKHELGHAMGLYHEQSRSDRNAYIKVNYTNVRAGYESNFFRASTDNYGIEYDFLSLMHYSATTFSKNGGATLVTLDPAKQIYLGQGNDLTFRDVAIVNKMYGCSEFWNATCSSSLECENGGYLGSTCECVCPPGTSGDTCSDVTGSYYPEAVCGGNITTNTVIMSPGYPNNFPRGTNCLWWIEAPSECLMPVVTVEDFKLFGTASNGHCAWDRLEVRTESILYGKEYCGTQLTGGTRITSQEGSILLYFHGRLGGTRGFRFQVTFEQTCVQCSVSQRSSGLMEWKSPSYPLPYPAGIHCSITVQKAFPAMTRLVYRNVYLNKNCADKFVVTSANGRTLKACGRRRGKALLIGTQHTATFTSGGLLGPKGWYVEFATKSSSCHNLIDLSTSPTGVLTSPRFPKKHKTNDLCEWWLRAPPGKKIKLTFDVLVLASKVYDPDASWYQDYFYDRFCNRGYVLLSLEGDAAYPTSSQNTYKLCGFRKEGYSVTSVANEMNLLFFGAKYRTMGMKVRYSLA